VQAQLVERIAERPIVAKGGLQSCGVDVDVLAASLDRFLVEFLIDVFVNDYEEETVNVTGTVVDDVSGAPLEGVLVSCAVYTSADAQEGPAAFREGRTPKWTGR